MRDRDMQELAHPSSNGAPYTSRSWGITFALVAMPHTLPYGTERSISLTFPHSPGKLGMRFRVGHLALVISCYRMVVTSR